MRYQVPQFTEVESKVFGPLSFRQFIYLLGSGAVVFVLYAVAPFIFVLLIGLPIAALGVALSFYKVNNQPFIKVIEHALNHFMSPKLFLWKKQEADRKRAKKIKKAEVAPQAQVYVPRFSKNKLKDLAWSLDIKEKSK